MSTNLTNEQKKYLDQTSERLINKMEYNKNFSSIYKENPNMINEVIIRLKELQDYFKNKINLLRLPDVFRDEGKQIDFIVTIAENLGEEIDQEIIKSGTKKIKTFTNAEKESESNTKSNNKESGNNQKSGSKKSEDNPKNSSKSTDNNEEFVEVFETYETNLNSLTNDVDGKKDSIINLELKFNEIKNKKKTLDSLIRNVKNKVTIDQYNKLDTKFWTIERKLETIKSDFESIVTNIVNIKSSISDIEYELNKSSNSKEIETQILKINKQNDELSKIYNKIKEFKSEDENTRNMKSSFNEVKTYITELIKNARLTAFERKNEEKLVNNIEEDLEVITKNINKLKGKNDSDEISDLKNLLDEVKKIESAEVDSVDFEKIKKQIKDLPDSQKTKKRELNKSVNEIVSELNVLKVNSTKKIKEIEKKQSKVKVDRNVKLIEKDLAKFDELTKNPKYDDKYIQDIIDSAQDVENFKNRISEINELLEKIDDEEYKDKINEKIPELEKRLEKHEKELKRIQEVKTSIEEYEKKTKKIKTPDWTKLRKFID